MHNIELRAIGKQPGVLRRLLTVAALFILFAAFAGATNAAVNASSTTITGRVVFDTGQPVAGARVKGTLYLDNTFLPVVPNRAGQLQEQAATRVPAAAQPGPVDEMVTNASGAFTLTVGPRLPVRVLLEVRYRADGMPLVQTAKWGDVRGAQLDLGTIVIPNPQGAELTLTAGSGQNADGSIQVAGLPTAIKRLYGRAYDPDETPNAFPGEFAEESQIPLNSSVFLWMEALDAAGRPVDSLDDAATIRSRVPESQWRDLEDINSGTDRIDVPIYSFNEATQMWEQMGVGWLEDEVGTVLPEDAEPVILSGDFAGELYAVFETMHLSWMNVDYPYIGPWTLSRIDRDKRNNDCLYNAMQLARTIAMSQAGRTAYAKFNVAGGNLDVELADGAGPELKSGNIGNNYGEFKGNEQGDRDDQLYVGQQLWNGCGEGATDAQKKNTTLIMAVTLLHESAHWKWDVKHEGGNWKNAEPGGEAGNQLEKDLFGGIITNGNGIRRDGNPVNDATRDGWLNPANWPPPPLDQTGAAPLAQPAMESEAQQSPLQLTLSLSQATYQLGEPVIVTVTYRNRSNDPIRVLGLTELEGYPLWFEIVRAGETTRVPYRGGRIKREIDWVNDFVTLQPGETLQRTVNLLRSEQTGEQRYNLIRSGTYQISAFYSGLWGIPAAESNQATFTLAAGGRVAGLVTSAISGEPISDTTISALQDIGTVDVAVSHVDGTYVFPELPTGVYTVEARSPGFLRGIQAGVRVTTGQTTTVNFAMSPLLAQGQLRIVLTWGTAPNDLDSHLWLPADVPYHIYFADRGRAETCPFANLDVDDTSGLGPETISIVQRYNTGKYIYAVDNFSGSPEITASEAQVQVFDSTGLIATYAVPTQGTGRWWHVFDLAGPTGLITEVNQLKEESPAPYTLSTGCGEQSGTSQTPEKVEKPKQ